MATKPPLDPRVAYIKGIVKLDELLKRTMADEDIACIPERREELINTILENRAELMADRDRPFRVVDKRRIK